MKAVKAAKKAWVIEFFFSFYFWHLDADNKRQELNSFLGTKIQWNSTLNTWSENVKKKIRSILSIYLFLKETTHALIWHDYKNMEKFCGIYGTRMIEKKKKNLKKKKEKETFSIVF